MSTFAERESTLRRCLAAVADSVHPSPTALEVIRAGTDSRPSLAARIWSALTRAVPQKAKEINMTTPIPKALTDPIELPLRLLPTDVITRNPHTGEPGQWTFFRGRDLGLTVLLGCLDANHNEVEFTVQRSTPIHIAPRGRFEDFWGVAL